MYEQLMGELASYAGPEGLSPSDLLGLPDALRGLVTWLARCGEASQAGLAAHIGCEQAACAELAGLLIARGLVGRTAEGMYRVNLVGRRARPGSGRLRKLFEE